MRRTMGMAVVLGLAVACGGNDGGGGAAAFTDAMTSACGGFGNAVEALSAGDYCAAEVLDWAYDAETSELTLLHQRTTLNCCGEHSVSAAWEGDAVVVTSVDEPEAAPGGGARCGCMCVFDFGVTVLQVPAGTAQALTWRETVTDQDDGDRVVFDGTLDLSAGSGRVVISDAESMWCQADSAL